MSSSSQNSIRYQLSRIYFLGVWGTLIGITGLQSWSQLVEAKTTPRLIERSAGTIIERRAPDHAFTALHSGDATHTDSRVRRIDSLKI